MRGTSAVSLANSKSSITQGKPWNEGGGKVACRLGRRKGQNSSVSNRVFRSQYFNVHLFFFFFLSGSQLVLPFSTYSLYEMYFTSLCQVSPKISLMHEVQGAFPSFLILYRSGNTDKCFSVVSPLVSVLLWGQLWRALMMRKWWMRRKAFLYKPATWGLRLASLVGQENSPYETEAWSSR